MLLAPDPQSHCEPSPHERQDSMTCHSCQSICMKWGKSGKQIQRYRCHQCKRTFLEEQNNPLGDMRIPIEKAELCLQLLLEGNSIRSTTRITGLHQVTILNLLVLAGEKGERLMYDRIKGVAVKDAEAAENSALLGMKKINVSPNDVPHLRAA